MIVEKSISQYNLTQLLLLRESADDSTKLAIDEEIRKRKISKDQYDKSLRELDYVRMQKLKSALKPLPWYLKISYIIAPIIPNNIFEQETLERDLQKDLSRSNINQRRQENLFRKFGLIFYLLLIISFLLYSNSEKQKKINDNISNYRTNDERVKHGIPIIPDGWNVKIDLARDVWTNEANIEIKHQDKITSKIREFDRFVNNSQDGKGWILEQEFNFLNLRENENPWSIVLISTRNQEGEYKSESQSISKEQADSVLIKWGLN